MTEMDPDGEVSLSAELEDASSEETAEVKGK